MKRPTGPTGFDTICQVHDDTDVPFLLTLTNTTQAQGVALWVDGSALSASAIDNDDGEEIFLAGKSFFQFLTGIRLSGDPADANHTPTGAQCALYVDAGSGGVTITLPSIVGNANRVYYVFKVAGAGSVTVAPDGSETINGVNSSKSISTQWNGLRLTAWVDTPDFHPDGAGWIASLLTAA